MIFTSGPDAPAGLALADGAGAAAAGDRAGLAAGVDTAGRRVVGLGAVAGTHAVKARLMLARTPAVHFTCVLGSRGHPAVERGEEAAWVRALPHPRTGRPSHRPTPRPPVQLTPLWL